MTSRTEAPEEVLLLQEPSSLRSFWASISAVFAKESRWRMRGRRAFVVVTVYVSLVSLLVFAVYQFMYGRALEQARFLSEGIQVDLVSGAVSAEIGQAIFTAILVAQTLLTVMVAPAMTSGAISSEREKQTFELLITTPISTLGLVVGKLVSSLAYVFLLIAASVPLMSMVFVFGGLAPEDLVRAYVLLVAVAFGIGSIGLWMSALVRRTQVATVVSYLIVLALTIGTLALHTYLVATTSQRDRGFGEVTRHAAPQAILWLNPLVADVDVVCTAIPESYGFTCSYISIVTTGREGAVPPPRDAFWPISTAAFVILGVGLTLLTTKRIALSRRFRRLEPPAADIAQPSGS